MFLQELGKDDRYQFILVQLPEPCDPKRDAYKDGYETLCDIGEGRIRRAGDKIKTELEESNRQLKLGEGPKQLPDIGFRVFELDESGIEKPEPGQLLFDVVKPDRSDMDIVFEMMLKWGLELTLPVEKSEAAGYPIWSVACDELVCCMSRGLTIEALEAIADMEPRRVLILDSVLDDTLKLNAVQSLQARRRAPWAVRSNRGRSSMAALEFKFSSDQQHQLEAIEATCDLFRGQQFIGSVFSADSGRKGQTAIGELMVGHGNELRVAPGQLLDNLHAVQEEGCLPATDVLTDGRLRDFTVEMETGTGKTYVYIRSIYELNRRYGITKFVIVVPSVAIREGVLKSLQTTRRHFETLYDRTPLDYFVYDSKDIGPVGRLRHVELHPGHGHQHRRVQQGPREGWHREGGQPLPPSQREAHRRLQPSRARERLQARRHHRRAPERRQHQAGQGRHQEPEPAVRAALLGHAQAGLQHDLPPHAGTTPSSATW